MPITASLWPMVRGRPSSASLDQIASSTRAGFTAAADVRDAPASMARTMAASTAITHAGA